MDPKQYETFIDKLDKLTRLMAVQTVRGLEEEQAKVELLDSIGFRPFEIEKLLNKTPGYASAALANIKKRHQKTARQSSTSQPLTPPQSPPQTSGGREHNEPE